MARTRLVQNSVQWQPLRNKPLASIIGLEFPEQLSNYQLLKKDPTPKGVIR
jgi:hypothetical protein